jgi:hypothetical protein
LATEQQRILSHTIEVLLTIATLLGLASQTWIIHSNMILFLIVIDLVLFAFVALIVYIHLRFNRIALRRTSFFAFLIYWPFLTLLGLIVSAPVMGLFRWSIDPKSAGAWTAGLVYLFVGLAITGVISAWLAHRSRFPE